tara:strand:- start:422 stop:1297 length:876 start_codon:yes stop_codon:yes gene_type:complete
MGIKFSSFYEQFNNMHMAPYYPLSREEEVFQEEKEHKINFRSLKDHPEVVKQLINTTITDDQYNDNIIMFLSKFVDEHIDKEKLRKNAFSKKVWGLKYKTTREYIEHIFREAIDEKVTFGKLIQKIVQNTVIDEFSGFTIYDTRKSRIIQAITYMNQIKQQNMEHNICEAFDGVEEGFMFLTEYDHPPINIPGIVFTQIQVCGNRSKAVVTKNMDVEIISFEAIHSEIIRRHQRTQYIVDCINHKDTPELFCLIKVENVYFLGVHLKSIGNHPAAKKMFLFILLSSVLLTG